MNAYTGGTGRVNTLALQHTEIYKMCAKVIKFINCSNNIAMCGPQIQYWLAKKSIKNTYNNLLPTAYGECPLAPPPPAGTSPVKEKVI